MRISRERSTLRQALQRYVDARTAALIDARRMLNIGEGDARALLFIADNPGVRPSQLRDYLGITSAGVTALVDRLVERSVVRRDLDPDDRRVNRLTLTIALDEHPWRALTEFDEAFESAVAAHDVEQTNDLADLLHSLTTSTTNGAR